MLQKITDTFYIDMEQIAFVDKVSKDIRIFMKETKNWHTPLTLSSLTKDGKEFMKALNRYVG
jgi:hypothetical protein